MMNFFKLNIQIKIEISEKLDPCIIAVTLKTLAMADIYNGFRLFLLVEQHSHSVWQKITNTLNNHVPLNCCTVGLLLLPLHALMRAKNISKASWRKLYVGMLLKNGVVSTCSLYINIKATISIIKPRKPTFWLVCKIGLISILSTTFPAFSCFRFFLPPYTEKLKWKMKGVNAYTKHFKIYGKNSIAMARCW